MLVQVKQDGALSGSRPETYMTIKAVMRLQNCIIVLMLSTTGRMYITCNATSKPAGLLPDLTLHSSLPLTRICTL